MDQNQTSGSDTRNRINDLHWQLSMDHLARTDDRRAVLGADFVAAERVVLDSVEAWLDNGAAPHRGRHELRGDAA